MSALISACGNYRYLLTRGALTEEARASSSVLFVMLNPSTADAELDDPTIRRCRNFAASWGWGGITVANLYAYRATKPAELWKVKDPVGPENDLHLAAMLSQDWGAIVCAWGVNARMDRVGQFLELARECGAQLQHLGTTRDGHPRHPLYLAKTQKPRPWRGIL